MGMKTDLSSKQGRALLIALQRGIPLVRRPWAAMGQAVGMTETEVLLGVRDLFTRGVARRFGAVFDARSLGYESTLCAAGVPAGELEAAVARIVSNPGITHCYEREGHPNLWFTLTAIAEMLRPELERVTAALGAFDVLDLPALRKFKIEAVFGSSEDSQAPLPRAPSPALLPVVPLAERERQIVRRLQASIEVTGDPFGLLARELGYGATELLELLKRWEQDGVIRRIALVLRHRQLGFAANSMCVWAVAPDRMEAAGECMAQSPHVTHCYERPSSVAFPFNLYAMVHAKTREEAVGIFEQLGSEAGLADGRMLWSAREFKKSSPVFFSEPSALGEPGSG